MNKKVSIPRRKFMKSACAGIALASLAPTIRQVHLNPPIIAWDVENAPEAFLALQVRDDVKVLSINNHLIDYAFRWLHKYLSIYLSGSFSSTICCR